MKRLTVSDVNDVLLAEKKTAWLQKLPPFFTVHLRETILFLTRKRHEALREDADTVFDIYDDELKKIRKLRNQIMDIREKKIMDLAWSTRKETTWRNNHGMEEEEQNLLNALIDLLKVWKRTRKEGIPFKRIKEVDFSLLQFDYRGYLNSNKWKELREQKLKETGGTCQICCGTENLNVHHRTYERIGDENLSDLTVLCRTGHTKFHAKGRGGTDE